MELPPEPELLKLAGMHWRFIEASDFALVIDNWTKSALKPFLAGVWRPDVGIKLDGGSESFLKVIYQSKVRQLITDTLSTGRVLVIVDDDTGTVIGWGCKHWIYVKLSMRGKGLGTLLLEATDERAAREEVRGTGGAWNRAGPGTTSAATPAGEPVR